MYVKISLELGEQLSNFESDSDMGNLVGSKLYRKFKRELKKQA